MIARALSPLGSLCRNMGELGSDSDQYGEGIRAVRPDEGQKFLTKKGEKVSPPSKLVPQDQLDLILPRVKGDLEGRSSR